jgi:hypothetical protein
MNNAKYIIDLKDYYIHCLAESLAFLVVGTLIIYLYFKSLFFNKNSISMITDIIFFF